MVHSRVDKWNAAVKLKRQLNLYYSDLDFQGQPVKITLFYSSSISLRLDFET